MNKALVTTVLTVARKSKYGPSFRSFNKVHFVRSPSELALEAAKRVSLLDHRLDSWREGEPDTMTNLGKFRMESLHGSWTSSGSMTNAMECIRQKWDSQNRIAFSLGEQPYNGLHKLCHAWVILGKEIWVCDRPHIFKCDDRWRLHCEDGPAIMYGDGTALYAWHGVVVGSKVITGDITKEEILNEKNAEVRRVMQERFGAERFLKEWKAKCVDESEYGKLWRIEFPDIGSSSISNDSFGIFDMMQDAFGMYIMIVEVENSTPEPDGTIKHYFLRVPPTCTTARRAVAWTFGLSEREYQPEAQS